MRKRIVSLFVTFCLVTTGCGRSLPVKPLPLEDLQKEVSGQYSIILMKLPTSSTGSLEDYSRIFATDFAAGAPPKLIEKINATSSDELEQGWIFFSLPPGRYLLELYLTPFSLQFWPLYRPASRKLVDMA